LVERIEREALGLRCPGVADELIGREALQGLEPPREVIGLDEVAEVLPELVVAFVRRAVGLVTRRWTAWDGAR
jgi:hypothetical protein